MKRGKFEEDPLLGLPQDVIHGILFRLPWKTLGLCKLVSKSWNSLISNPDFTKAHLQYYTSLGNNSSSWFLALQQYNTISLAKLNMTPFAEEDLIPLYKQFDPHLYGYYNQCLVGSSDGLVCVYLKSKDVIFDDLMYIWNPTMNQHKQICLPAERGLAFFHVGCSWFGFVPTLHTYKIFLVYMKYSPAGFERMYVCSLRDHEWREIRETNDNEVGYEERINFAWECNSVVMNEAVHHLVSRKWIHKFDLVTETFERIPFGIELDLPPNPWNHHVSIGVIGSGNNNNNNKCMCAMFGHQSDNHSQEWVSDLWILKEYNKWDSWIKSHRIDLQKEIAVKCTGFFGFVDSGYLCSEVEDGRRLLDLSRNPPYLYVINNGCGLKIYQMIDYVESLVSPLNLQ